MSDQKCLDLIAHADDEITRLRRDQPSRCKICECDTIIYDTVDFNKATGRDYVFHPSMIPIVYQICKSCRFIFTTFFDSFTPEQWTEFVYNADYITADPEYDNVRPQRAAHQLQAFLGGKKGSTIGLDYGGGNGTTTAVMRRWGWSFDCYDPFGHTDISEDRRGHYNFCLAAEVFEHTPDPVRSLRTIVDLCSPGPLTIMITTFAHDRAVTDKTRLSWWYAAPRNGHISLYSRKSLQILGENFGLEYAAISYHCHLLLRGIGAAQARRQLLRGKLLEKGQRLLRL